MYYNDLKKELKGKNLRSAYVLYGEDEGLIKEVVEDIGELSKVAPDDLFNFIRLDGQKVELSEMEDALMTLPFMGEKKYVEIYRADFFSGANSIKQWKEKIKLIEDVLKNPPEELILVVYYITDENKKDQKIKPLEKKADAKKSVVIKLPALKKQDVGEFLANYIKEHQIEIHPNTVTYLREQFEGNILQLEKEMEKFVAFANGRAIEKRDIDLLLVKSGTRHKYDLAALILAGKTREALELYHDLIFRRTEPHEILESLGYKLREVYNYTTRLAGGYSASEIKTDLGERFDWLVDKRISEYRRIPLRRTSYMLKELLQTEVRLKSTSINPEEEMEILILLLSASSAMR